MKYRKFLCAIALCAATTLAAYGQIPVVLDTDMGDDIDDALALGLALNSPELKVLAVNTVLQQGDRRADLTYRILELYGRTDIPVGVGAETTLMGTPNNNVVKQTTALAADYRMPPEKRHNGIQLLIDTVMKSSEKVTLLAYGPLTNVALALRAEPRMVNNVERIVLMNGVFFRPGLEYNTYRDAEASAIVYSSGVPIVAVGLDVTMQCRLSAEHLERMAGSKFENVRFLRELIGIWQEGHSDRRPILHDPLAILVAFRPSLVDTAQGSVTVETKGTPNVSYGLSVFKQDAKGTVRVAREVRAADAVGLFAERVIAPPRSR
jgi:purine nucleosidase/pyrimidine-specific ribonucleoside hydrolase